MRKFGAFMMAAVLSVGLVGCGGDAKKPPAPPTPPPADAPKADAPKADAPKADAPKEEKK